MRNVIAITCLLVPSLATAQRSTEAETTCLSITGHADARQCLISEDARSEKRLKQADGALMDAFKKWSEEESSKKRSVTAHRIALSEFERMRDSQCELMASLAAGGNSAEDRKLLCRIELNARYTKDLSAIAFSLK